MLPVPLLLPACVTLSLSLAHPPPTPRDSDTDLLGKALRESMTKTRDLGARYPQLAAAPRVGNGAVKGKAALHTACRLKQHREGEKNPSAPSACQAFLINSSSVSSESPSRNVQANNELLRAWLARGTDSRQLSSSLLNHHFGAGGGSGSQYLCSSSGWVQPATWQVHAPPPAPQDHETHTTQQGRSVHWRDAFWTSPSQGKLRHGAKCFTQGRASG